MIVKPLAPIPCGHCGDTFQPTREPRVERGLSFDVQFCDRCEEYCRRNPGSDPRPESRLRAWKIPPVFRKTDPARLDKSKLAEAMKWKFSPRGLLLAGVTRAGKTRTAFEALKWQVFRGRKVVYKTAPALALDIGEAVMGSRGMYRETLNRYKRAEILFVDDIGKEKLTPRVEEALFDLVCYRCDYEKPIFATTNFAPAELVARFSEAKTAEPIVERLIEFCDVITFPERLPLMVQGELVA